MTSISFVVMVIERLIWYIILLIFRNGSFYFGTLENVFVLLYQSNPQTEIHFSVILMINHIPQY